MQIRSLTLASGALLLATSMVAHADEAENRAVARDVYAAFNARNFDALDALIADAFVSHTARAPEGGLAALQEEMSTLVADMPDIRMTVELVLASGDYVTVISNLRGTEGGAMPAHQRIVDYTIVDVWLISDGLLTELWRTTDE